jgi:hypothetical protein
VQDTANPRKYWTTLALTYRESDPNG